MHQEDFQVSSHPIGGVLHDESASNTYTIDTAAKDHVVLPSARGRKTDATSRDE